MVVHLGLAHRSRARQVQRLADFLAAQVPEANCSIVAGDFNDWGEKLDPAMRELGLQRADSCSGRSTQRLTFPSRVPVFAMDRIYSRGPACASTAVRAAQPGRACPTTCRWWSS